MKEPINQESYFISFENVPAAEANRYAENLRSTLLDALPETQVERQRHDSTAQDAGQQLLIQILTSPATGTIGGAVIGLLVTTISKWLSRHPNASLTFKRPQGDIIATGITNRTAVKLTKLLLAYKEDSSNQK